MSDSIITVENLSKHYLVGHQSDQRAPNYLVGDQSDQRAPYRTLRDVISREMRNFARKTLDAVNGRQIVQGDEVEAFWALKDVSFQVKRGEVLGIIGRNGAGKSTLLKILSRITEPSQGRAIVRGRVASLLEVGTGFHPELTGRENIYLNGAILGMTREEIRSKFDEIVAFSEVEKFLDTPVKRYSSGMYVRLAFAVAAHLETEILMVDEVLAVGDFEFQKKCLGKIKDFSQSASGGRTILFVSHDISAVRALCGTGIYLHNGRVQTWGPIEAVIADYFNSGITPSDGWISDDVPRDISTGEARIRKVQIVDANSNCVTALLTGQPIKIVVQWEVLTAFESGMIEIGIASIDGRQITQSLSSDDNHGLIPMKPGIYEIQVEINDVIFPGRYSLLSGIHKRDGTTVEFIERAIEFEILNTGKGEVNHYAWSVRGTLRPSGTWTGPFAVT
jgi:ABC-type polysaccharide/polyol phosphate transport system ATPase subunit